MERQHACNSTTKVSFCTITFGSEHGGNHDDEVRIFAACLFCVLVNLHRTNFPHQEFIIGHANPPTNLKFFFSELQVVGSVMY